MCGCLFLFFLALVISGVLGNWVGRNPLYDLRLHRPSARCIDCGPQLLEKRSVKDFYWFVNRNLPPLVASKCSALRPKRRPMRGTAGPSNSR